MTSVLGHLTNAEFPDNYRSWSSCAPIQLFDAPINITVNPVRLKSFSDNVRYSQDRRISSRLPATSRNKLDIRRPCSYGRIVIAKESTSDLKSGRLPSREIKISRSKEQGSVTRSEGNRARTKV